MSIFKTCYIMYIIIKEAGVMAVKEVANFTSIDDALKYVSKINKVVEDDFIGLNNSVLRVETFISACNLVRVFIKRSLIVFLVDCAFCFLMRGAMSINSIYSLLLLTLYAVALIGVYIYTVLSKKLTSKIFTSVVKNWSTIKHLYKRHLV